MRRACVPQLPLLTRQPLTRTQQNLHKSTLEWGRQFQQGSAYFSLSFCERVGFRMWGCKWVWGEGVFLVLPLFSFLSSCFPSLLFSFPIASSSFLWGLSAELEVMKDAHMPWDLTGLSAIEKEEVYLAELLNTYKTMVASKNQPIYTWHIQCLAV